MRKLMTMLMDTLTENLNCNWTSCTRIPLFTDGYVLVFAASLQLYNRQRSL